MICFFVKVNKGAILVKNSTQDTQIILPPKTSTKSKKEQYIQDSGFFFFDPQHNPLTSYARANEKIDHQAKDPFNEFVQMTDSYFQSLLGNFTRNDLKTLLIATLGQENYAKSVRLLFPDRYQSLMNKNQMDQQLLISERDMLKTHLRIFSEAKIREIIKEELRNFWHLFETEIIAVYLVRNHYKKENQEYIVERDVILLDQTMLVFDYENINAKNDPKQVDSKLFKFSTYGDDIRTLNENSLTRKALLNRDMVYRDGQHIAKSPEKRFPNHQFALYTGDGMLHSLMRLSGTKEDYFCMNPTGSRNFFLISLENKLEKSGKKYQVIHKDQIDQKKKELQKSNAENYPKGKDLVFSHLRDNLSFTLDDFKNIEDLRDKLMQRLEIYLIFAFHADIPIHKYNDIVKEIREKN